MRVLYLDGNPDLTRDQLAPEGEPMTNPKILAEPESTELLDRLAPDWPLLLYDGAVIDHILKMINRPRPSRSDEAGMIALTLVRVIERHSDALAAELVTKLRTSPRTTDLCKVPVEELQRQI